MQHLTGKPELMKKMNITLVYQTLIEMRSATRAEIANKTQISTTTVRTLLEELLQSGEIVELALDESSGGRRAQRYAANLRRNLILSLYLEKETIVYRINDILGNVVKTGSENAGSGNAYQSVVRFISKCLDQWAICAVGLGVPGIVEKGRYYVSSGLDQWIIHDIGEQIQNAYHLPVMLENDLNAIAFGFAKHFANKRKDCPVSEMNMAYIHFDKSCTGAGIIVDGKVIRGAKQFAGELGFLPLEPDKTLDIVLQTATSVEECVDAVCRAISTVNCVTNPSFVVIGGERLVSHRISLEQIKARVQAYISGFVQPEIIFSQNYREDYLAGLSYLTLDAQIPKLPQSGAVSMK